MVLARVYAYAAVVALIIAVMGVQQWRVQHYRSQAITLQSAVDTFKSAQKTNLDTIAALRGANEDWARKCAADQAKALTEAQNSVTADRKGQFRLDASIKTLRAEAQDDVSVKAWYDQPVPAAAVRMLTKGGAY